MRRPILAAVAACSLGLSNALAGPAISPTLDLTEVTLRVVWSTDDEIRAVRAKYEGAPTVRERRAPSKVYGFSVLARDAEGRYVCTLYVERPRNVDDGRTRSLGHELLHCLAGAYHD